MPRVDSLTQAQLATAAEVVQEYNETGAVNAALYSEATNAGLNPDYLMSVAADLQEIIDAEFQDEDLDTSD